jgi:hypothetical protein
MVLRIDVSLLHARTAAAHPRLHRHAQRVLDTIDATIRSVQHHQRLAPEHPGTGPVPAANG